LVTEQRGKFVLARIDVAANPRLAQAFQVQAVPAAMAVIKGQPVPLFQGAPAAEQIRPVLDQLLQLAKENGVTGEVDAGEQAEESEEPAEPPLPPHLQAAYDAIEADDLDSAIAAFEQAIKENPADAEAAAGLAQVQLLQRIAGLDPAQVLQRATEAKAGDLDAQLPAADLEVAGGRRGRPGAGPGAAARAVPDRPGRRPGRGQGPPRPGDRPVLTPTPRGARSGALQDGHPERGHPQLHGVGAAVPGHRLRSQGT